eukprot:365268-Chlamydomonas_euryale.AAC.2
MHAWPGPLRDAWPPSPFVMPDLYPSFDALASFLLRCWLQASLQSCVPASDRVFVNAFMETQMFSVWCDQVISAQIEKLRD